MEKVDPIRAWKDVDYRLSLDPQQRELLPDHPAGDIILVDVELDGCFTESATTAPYSVFECYDQATAGFKGDPFSAAK